MNGRDRDFFDEISNMASAHFRHMMQDFVTLPMPMLFSNRMLEDRRDWPGYGSVFSEGRSPFEERRPFESPPSRGRDVFGFDSDPWFDRGMQHERSESLWNRFDRPYPQTEFDMYQAQAQYQEGANDPIVSEPGEAKTVVSTSTSRSTRTRADGSSTTKVMTKKIYADGTSETFEDEHHTMPRLESGRTTSSPQPGRGRVREAAEGQITELPSTEGDPSSDNHNTPEGKDNKGWFWK